MKIFEATTYTMYLTDKEFELLHEICSEIDYAYSHTGNVRNEEGYWKIIANEDMMNEIQNLLDKEYYYQLYEECNKRYAYEIKDLLDSIYCELNY